MRTCFFVTSHEDVILGMSWLKKENPQIDWTVEEVYLYDCKVSVEETDEENIFYDTQETLEEEWDPAQETSPTSFPHKLPNLLETE
jgi:hypothetical protein